MPNYDFNFTPSPAAFPPMPMAVREVPGVRQTAHLERSRDDLSGSGTQPYYLEQFAMPAFHALDDAMIRYFSGIRVPTDDSYRFMRVKVAGGDKSLLVWADDLKEGMAVLPVAALDRASVDFNPERYSPPVLSMATRFLNSGRTKIARVFRPQPVLVPYTLIIWAAHKRDVEHILFQILPRFNSGMAEFRMTDGHISGNVQLQYKGCNDVSDKEVGFNQDANIRYEVSMVAEAWLPLPEKVVPTILGKIGTLRDEPGSFIEEM